MEADQILSLLPNSLLEELAIETDVNKYSKKLQGEVIFKLLIFCILSHKNNSLRTMESAYESAIFKLLNNEIDSKKKVRFSSISERLSNINSDYFEQLYKSCLSIYGDEIEEYKSSVIRFDSTIVALSSQLLKVGYHIKGGDAAHLKQLKFTVGFSELPVAVNFYTEQQHSSENTALGQTVLGYNSTKSDVIKIFDRGITSRKIYDDLQEAKSPFISRLSSKFKYDIDEESTLPEGIQTNSLFINSDEWIYLFKDKGVKAKSPVRCIRAISKLDGKPITFVTNLAELSAEEITELYKRRWDIEIFFKFLKQELNFSHLVNRSENGIRVMLYSTLIAAILLLVYKKKNNLTGYKIMKVKFLIQLENAIMRDIVLMCGGDLEVFNKRFGTSSP